MERIGPSTLGLRRCICILNKVDLVPLACKDDCVDTLADLWNCHSHIILSASFLMVWLVCKSTFYGTKLATNELAGHKPETSQLHLVNTCPAGEIISQLTSEASSTMGALSGARCTDARLYTLGIKIGTRKILTLWTRLWCINWSNAFDIRVSVLFFSGL